MNVDYIKNCYKVAGYTGNDMTNFIPNVIRSDSLIVVGICPSTKTGKIKTNSRHNLEKWMHEASVKAWDFQNVIPHKINCLDPDEVFYDLLEDRLLPFGKVIALGGFVSKVLKKIGIPHLQIYHPSTRNRALNSKENHVKTVKMIKKYLND
jgi:hypothetical protein